MREVVVVGLLLGCAPAFAGDWLVGGSVGPGVAVTRYAYDGPGGFGTGSLEQSDVGAFAALAVDLRLGRSLGERFALGLELEASLTIAGDATLGFTGYDGFVAGAARVVAVWRRPRGLTYALAGGAQLAGTTGYVATVGAHENAADLEDVAGPALKAALGWRWGTAQLELEASTAYLRSEHLSVIPAMLTLRARVGAL
jgi:hypothetical protein